MEPEESAKPDQPVEEESKEPAAEAEEAKEEAKEEPEEVKSPNPYDISNISMEKGETVVLKDYTLL